MKHDFLHDQETTRSLDQAWIPIPLFTRDLLVRVWRCKVKLDQWYVLRIDELSSGTFRSNVGQGIKQARVWIACMESRLEVMLT